MVRAVRRHRPTARLDPSVTTLADVVLPRSASTSMWLAAALAGSIGPDDFAEAARGEDAHHLFEGWPGRPDPFELWELPGAARAWLAAQAELPGAPGLVITALPAPGDPVGLAGPPRFNIEAIEAGEALILGSGPGRPGLGLVPAPDARTTRWRAHPLTTPRPLDRAEAVSGLRLALSTATTRLAQLDVASWQPEIPDALMNLRTRAPIRVAPGVDPARAEALERAILCRQIVELAAEADSGAVTASEAEARRLALADLDRAARRAMAGLCSDSLGPS